MDLEFLQIMILQISSSGRNAKLKYQNSGSTGTSLSTSFSFEKVL